MSHADQTLSQNNNSLKTIRSSQPLYMAIADKLQHQIENGTLGFDGAIPAERQLSLQFGVSRVTIRKALQKLRLKGILDPRQGSGTFILTPPKVEQKLSNLTSFTEDMESRRHKVGVHWLERSTGRASPEEILNLGLSPGETVTRLHRLRLADDEPMALELSVLPTRYLNDPHAVGNSLYTYLRQNGLVPFRALQRLTAACASDEQAKLLGIKCGAPLLYIERRTMLEDGSPLEFVCSHYRGDIYDFIVELTLTT